MKLLLCTSFKEERQEGLLIQKDRIIGWDGPSISPSRLSYRRARQCFISLMPMLEIAPSAECEVWYDEIRNHYSRRKT